MRPIAALLLVAAAPACAASTAASRAATPAAEAPAHRVERVSEHAYAIFGRGGNVGLFLGEREAVIVDSQYEPGGPGLLEAVASVTSLPLKLLVNTHHHPDHVGGNPLLGGRVHAIVAHANVRRRLEAEQSTLEPARRGGLPTLLVGAEDPEREGRLDVRLPGLELHLVHRRAAHTDGDLLVGMPSERVLHMGDVMFLGVLPFVDVQAGGGSFEGLLDTVSWLASWVPDDARIIPGHGPLAGKKELLRYRDFLAALKAHAAASPGASSHQLAETFDAAAWPEWQPNPAFVTWETLFDAVTGRGPGRVPRQP